MVTFIKSLEIAAFREMSARIGGEPMLVHGGTGNTSIKLDGILWIKASGKWLAHAASEDLLVPVDLAEARNCVRQGREIEGTYVTLSGRELNPSIETAMHAILPYRVVIHAHAINSIAWSVRSDGPAALGERLRGLPWQWIPYTPSGIPLAKEIERALAVRGDTTVFVLGNHGLLVCAETSEDAERLLREVERGLAIAPRTAPETDCARLNQMTGSGWLVPRMLGIAPEVHALGTDPISRRMVTKGVLYPCQAIFFGAHIPVSRCHSRGYAVVPPAGSTPLLIVEDGGVLVNEKITRAEAAVLTGLALVLQRVDGAAPVRYLCDEEVAEARRAESYRDRALLETV